MPPSPESFLSPLVPPPQATYRRSVSRILAPDYYHYYSCQLFELLPFAETRNELISILANYCKRFNKRCVKNRKNLLSDSKLAWEKFGFRVFLDGNGDISISVRAKFDEFEEWRWLDSGAFDYQDDLAEYVQNEAMGGGSDGSGELYH